MFGIFVHYSTRPIYDVSMNLFCWPPSVDIFNILPGFFWQPLLITFAFRLPTSYTDHYLNFYRIMAQVFSDKNE